MPKSSADPRLEHLWRERLRRWRASALSVRAFCARESLAESSFYFWRTELRRRDARPAPAPFVPVHVAAPPPAPPAAPLELVTAAGTLRIPPGCDPALLRVVLAVLGERPC